MSNSTPATRILVADDNPIVRSGLVSLLEATGEVQVVAEAENGRQAIDLADRHRPDLVLLDVRMPELDGVQAVSTLSASCPVVMLTYTEDADIVRAAIRGGASGYLVHGTFTADQLTGYVRSAVNGANPLSPQAASAVLEAVREDPVTSQADRSDPGRLERHTTADMHLSAREAEIMDLISRGRANGEIAADLFLSEKTVKNHVNRIYAKLNVTSRAAAIARWIGTDA